MTYDMFKTSNIYVNKLRVYQKPEQIFHVYLDVYMLSYMKLHASGVSETLFKGSHTVNNWDVDKGSYTLLNVTELL